MCIYLVINEIEPISNVLLAVFSFFKKSCDLPAFSHITDFRRVTDIQILLIYEFLAYLYLRILVLCHMFCSLFLSIFKMLFAVQKIKMFI